MHGTVQYVHVHTASQPAIHPSIPRFQTFPKPGNDQAREQQTHSLSLHATLHLGAYLYASASPYPPQKGTCRLTDPLAGVTLASTREINDWD